MLTFSEQYTKVSKDNNIILDRLKYSVICLHSNIKCQGENLKSEFI